MPKKLKPPVPLSRSGSRSIPIHQIGGERQKRTGIVENRKHRIAVDRVVRTGKKRTFFSQIGKKFLADFIIVRQAGIHRITSSDIALTA